MRGDQPVRAPASPAGSPSTAATLTDLCQGLLGPAGACASVGVLEPDDVIELRGRDLQDRRVLDGRDAMDGARPEAEADSGRDHLLLQEGVSGGAQLELRPPVVDEPRLVLLPVELEAERLPGLHEQDLADVLV